MTKFVSRFMNDESGATAIEYGLIAAVIVGAVSSIGTNLKTKFTSVSTAVATAPAS
ncbi:MAG: Flp family type IVb pilin [Asticcacaulis sp.]